MRLQVPCGYPACSAHTDRPTDRPSPQRERHEDRAATVEANHASDADDCENEADAPDAWVSTSRAVSAAIFRCAGWPDDGKDLRAAARTAPLPEGPCRRPSRPDNGRGVRAAARTAPLPEAPHRRPDRPESPQAVERTAPPPVDEGPRREYPGQPRAAERTAPPPGLVWKHLTNARTVPTHLEVSRSM